MAGHLESRFNIQFRSCFHLSHQVKLAFSSYFNAVASELLCLAIYVKCEACFLQLLRLSCSGAMAAGSSDWLVCWTSANVYVSCNGPRRHPRQYTHYKSQRVLHRGMDAPEQKKDTCTVATRIQNRKQMETRMEDLHAHCCGNEHHKPAPCHWPPDPPGTPELLPEESSDATSRRVKGVSVLLKV